MESKQYQVYICDLIYQRKITEIQTKEKNLKLVVR